MGNLLNEILNHQKPPTNVFSELFKSLKQKRKWKSAKQGAADALMFSLVFSHFITWGWDFLNCPENFLPLVLSSFRPECNYCKATLLTGTKACSDSRTAAACPGLRQGGPHSVRPDRPNCPVHPATPHGSLKQLMSLSDQKDRLAGGHTTCSQALSRVGLKPGAQ